jgi:phosphate transport system protein
VIEHTTRAFDADLGDLAGKIKEMGRIDARQIEDAITALRTHDEELAKRVIDADDLLDNLQRRVEDKAVVTIARRQPMAIDLREIIGALRIANDLERIGDLAENIAKRVALFEGGYRKNEIVLWIDQVMQLVLAQLAAVLRSYERHDVDEALHVWHRDRRIDALNELLFRELLTYMMEDPRYITYCTHLLFCAANIERMGDHITNIAETVYYITRGTTLTKERRSRNAETPASRRTTADSIRGPNEILRTAGNPGAPKGSKRDRSIDLIRSEAYRRILAGEAPETLTAFAEQLSQWLCATHPGRTTMAPGIIEEHVRDTWHRRHELVRGG